MAIKLDVPYRSQHGAEAAGRNDCGPACVAMVAGVSVAAAAQVVRQLIAEAEAAAASEEDDGDIS